MIKTNINMSAISLHSHYTLSLKSFSKLTPSSITNAGSINSQQCFSKVRTISRNGPAEDIKKLRYLVVSWMFCKYLQQFHEFCGFHNGRHYSSWTEDPQLYAVSAGESIDAANSRNGEGGWNREIRWQEIRLMDAWMSGELGGR